MSINGPELARVFIASFIAGVSPTPMKVEMTVDGGDPARPVTVFTISALSERDAALVIGSGGKNIQAVRGLVHIIACRHKFAPSRVIVQDPLSHKKDHARKGHKRRPQREEVMA